MTRGTDRRKYPRYPLHATVKWRVRKSAGEASWHEDVLLNLGDQGAFLQTRRLAARGACLELALPLRDGPVTVRAKVRWISSEQPAGMGLRFMALPPTVTDKVITEVLSGRFARPAAPPTRQGEMQFFASDISELI